MKKTLHTIVIKIDIDRYCPQCGVTFFPTPVLKLRCLVGKLHLELQDQLKSDIYKYTDKSENVEAFIDEIYGFSHCEHAFKMSNYKTN